MLLAAASAAGAGMADAAAAVPADLAYGTEVRWSVDGLPEIGQMEATIRGVLNTVHVTYAGSDGAEVEGFYPGANYAYFGIPGWTPFKLYARDTATILPMARYYYGPVALRGAIEEFFRLQYPDGSTSATVAPDFKVDKATTVSDEETSLIVAAAEAYDVLPDPAWLKSNLRGVPLIERLNQAMRWVLSARRDAGTRLIKRAHTTDWGDVKFEVAENPTDIQPGDQWTVSIYDQAIGYAALQGLATLNLAAGRPTEAAEWERQAATLRADTDAVLWDDRGDRGYYRIHQHLEPNSIEHPFDEGDIIAIGNAAALYYGLADQARAPRIAAALERARVRARAPLAGLTLDPTYPNWLESQMDSRVYQNGAIWDWWGGRQITGEFRTGSRRLATEHLLTLAREWALHPGKVREWESPWLNRIGRDETYAGAAAVVGQAVVEGLFGVDLMGDEVRLSPRLGQRAGEVRVYQPANDRYAAYRYEPSSSRLTLSYGTNSPTALSVRLPLLWGGETTALLNQKDVLPMRVEQLGEDRLGALVVPSGQQRIDLVRTPVTRLGPR